MTDLTDLLARVEAAEGPDDELFARIAHATVPDFSVEPDWRWREQFYRYTSARAWTEAALALVERVLPGWIVRADIRPDGSEISVEPPWKSLDIPRGLSFWPAVAKTPALALLAALLKALIAQQSTPQPQGQVPGLNNND